LSSAFGASNDAKSLDRALDAPFLYRGKGLLVDVETPLVLEILTASSSAGYSFHPERVLLVEK
jgi:hypothetical protein